MEASESWACLFTDEADTEEAWPRLLRRPPQTIEWTDVELRTLLDEDAADRQGSVLREISHAELLRFRIGLDGLGHRPVRAGDGVTAVVAEQDVTLVDNPDGTFARVLAGARAAGSSTAVIAVGRAAFLERVSASARAEDDTFVVALTIPDTPFLLDPLTRIGVKMLLNAVSTCTMVRMGRVLGNRMIALVPSNLKLIDRSTRYIRDLADVPYERACQVLFEVIEYVEPRRRLGKASPAPVGVATMALRYGLSLPEAEARLLQELG
jgi:N-acetylmuramic acid 6-phosphate etherase